MFDSGYLEENDKSAFSNFKQHHWWGKAIKTWTWSKESQVLNGFREIINWIDSSHGNKFRYSDP